MNWFTLKPHELCKEALKSIDAWWTSSGSYVDEYHVIKFGNLMVHLCGNRDVARREYFLYTQQPWKDEWAGLASAPGEGPHETAQYHMWIYFQRTKRGIMLFNPWGLGHEFFHIIRSAFELMGDKTVADPDQVDKEEFYG